MHLPKVTMNKLGHYYESDDIFFHKHKATAILDGGAGVSIITNQYWEAWGEPNIMAMILVMKLANKTMARLLSF